MSNTLYDITEEFRQLERAIIDAGGVVTDEIEAEYDDLLDAADDKTEAYIAVIQEKTTLAKAVKEEEKRLRARRKALENTADSLKTRLLDSMRAMGQDERETALGKVRRMTASRRSLVIEDEDAVPGEFVRTRTSVDKRAIRDYLDAEGVNSLTGEGGDAIAFLDEPTEYVRIY
jgi:hypothetical protein